MAIMMPRRLSAQPPAAAAALRHARRQMCARLLRTADEPDEGFARDYPVVVGEVEAHLRHEQAIMEASHARSPHAPPDERLHEQRQEDAAILAALHHTLPQVEDGELETARQLVAALADILSLHRISTDLALAPRGPAQAAPARMRGRAARQPVPRPARRVRRPAPSERLSFRLSLPAEVPMSLHTILVHVDQSRHAPARIHAAARLARAHGAHLTGAAMLGVSRAIFPEGYEARPGSLSAACFDPLVENARRELSRFEAIASEHGVSHDTRLVFDETDDGLALLSRFADLVVVSQDDPAESLSDHVLPIPDYVIVNSPHPVLVIPHGDPPSGAGPGADIGRRILLAWDGSREAAVAMGAAVPLLRRADSVTVAMLSGAGLSAADCQAQQAELAGFLGRHQVRPTIVVREHGGEHGSRHGGDIGRALLSIADELGCDLLVMGCYGHSRLRELCLGGASRTVLAEARIPALLAH
jgi:nucleotide-binding universal stress UspA family protein